VVYDTLVRGNIISGANQQICNGETPSSISFSSPGGGSNNFSYQWEVSVDGTSWSNIPGQTTLSFSPGNLFQTTYYRLHQMDNHCSPVQTVFTDSVIVIVYDTLVEGNINIGADQQICNGDTPFPLSFTQPSGGSGNFSYQWESSIDNTTWSDIPGTNSLFYVPGALTDTTYFRIKQTDTHCSPSQVVYTSSLMVGVYDSFQQGYFTGYQDTICEGESLDSLVNFSIIDIEGADSNQYIYVWHSDTVSNGSFSDSISSDSTLWLSTGVLTRTTYYRLTVITHCGDTAIYSDTLVSIIVNPLPGNEVDTIAEQQEDEFNICDGSLGRIFMLSNANANPQVGVDWSNNGQFQGLIRASDSIKILVFDEVSSSLSATYKNRQTSCSRTINWRGLIDNKIAPSRRAFVHRQQLNMLIYEDTTGDNYKWGWIPIHVRQNIVETELELHYLNTSGLLPYAIFNQGTSNNHVIDLESNIYFVEITKDGCMSRVLFNPSTTTLHQESFEEEQTLYLFPNPSDGDVFLRGEISQIEFIRLSSTLGKTLPVSLNTSNGRLEGIDNLPSGSYVLSVQLNNEIVNLRMIINK
ncbi:MAG: T9SS type A sorting domain-containing protein, partial [Cryomorphaceae bacterium]|nr:T9SS type A sorting domain-containing protein [Cryomorphaceae bacterium]